MRVGLGLAFVLVASTAAGQGFPFPTATPTKRIVYPTPRATPITTQPTPTATSYIPTYTPIPPASPTPSPGAPTITLRLGIYVVGVDVAGVDVVKYEAEIAGSWYTMTPRIGCWTDPANRCVSLGASAAVRVTTRDGRVYRRALPLSPPRVLLAQADGLVDLVRFTTPQP